MVRRFLQYLHCSLTVRSSLISKKKQSFECNLTLETRGRFLDISKAFYRVWHDGLLLKLKHQWNISGNLFQLIISFLSGRFQRVLLNGQTPDWEIIQAGVLRGSVLGPLFFLVYIHDLTNNLKSKVKLFAGVNCLLMITFFFQRSAIL